jgi:hypothetical protein
MREVDHLIHCHLTEMDVAMIAKPNCGKDSVLNFRIVARNPQSENCPSFWDLEIARKEIVDQKMEMQMMTNSKESSQIPIDQALHSLID